MAKRGERYVKLMRSIWTDDEWQQLTHPEQWCYLMLISQPDITPCGVVPMMERRWSRYASSVDYDTLETMFGGLTDAGFIHMDDKTGEIWVRSYMRYDGLYRSPNGRKAVDNSLDRVMSEHLRGVAAASFEKLLVDDNIEGATEGASQGATEGDTSPHHPSAIKSSTRNHHPQPPPVDNLSGSDDDENRKAAQVLEFLVTHKSTNARNPTAYARTVRANLATEQGNRIRELVTRYPTAPVSVIAGAIGTGNTRNLSYYAESENM